MQIPGLNLTNPFRPGEEQDEDIHVGTPEEPLAVPSLPFAKTGRNAQQSQRDRLRFLDKKGLLGKDIDPDLLLPAGGRRDRRAQKRAEVRGRRKMQRNYTRRMLRLEEEASDLANLFDIVDGNVPAAQGKLPAGHLRRRLAHDRIQARVMAIIEADRKRYDREWDARQKDRRLPAPKPVISHDEAWTQLRASLKSVRFTQRTPKVAAQ